MSKSYQKIAALVLAAVWLGMNMSALASAHVLQTSNGISAVLHIKPDDNPKAGKATAVNLLFSRSGEKFSLNDYKLSLRAVRDGQVDARQPLKAAFFGATREGEAQIMFSRPGVYDVIVVGQPTSAAAPAFKLDYIVRVGSSGVDQASLRGTNGAVVLLLSSVVLGLLAMVAVRNISAAKRYAARPPR